MILFGFQGSGSAAVEAALALVGAPCEIVAAASWEPGADLERLRSINPLVQIPTLVLPDGSVLTESAAILIHLGLTHPDSGLLPSDSAGKAQSIRGLVYIAANCYAAIGVNDYPERWCINGDAVLHENIRLGARARLHALWDTFADTFEGRPWLAGDSLGALDLLAAVVSKWSGSRPHLKQHRPEFFALLQRIENHPKVSAVFAAHWPPAAV